VVLTRSDVLDVRELVTVAEISTSARGLAAGVGLDHVGVGLDRASVVNGDGLPTVAQSILTSEVDGDLGAVACHEPNGTVMTA
jgi:mRNA-degrading endonuclease toxin of MazEF toxin-antitoxin module